MNTVVKNKHGVEYGVSVEMYLHHCCACGIPFSIPDEWDDRLRKNHESFYCPSGHAQSYTGNAMTKKEEQLKQELNSLKGQLESSKGNEKFWNEMWQKKVDENKKINKELKSVKTRVKNGVCPCCNRTFQDLAKHMKTKHPDQKAQ